MCSAYLNVSVGQKLISNSSRRTLRAALSLKVCQAAWKFPQCSSLRTVSGHSSSSLPCRVLVNQYRINDEGSMSDGHVCELQGAV